MDPAALNRPRSRRRGRGSAVWRPLLVVLIGAVVLALVPIVALAVTHRAPDRLFLHEWWTPIASVPPWTLAVGSVGLCLGWGAMVLLVATLFTRRAVHRRSVVAIVIACVVSVGLAGAWIVASHTHASTLADAVRASTNAEGLTADIASPQAADAIRGATAAPGGDTVRDLSQVPAGPWLVQDAEIINPKGQDEFADVHVGALVNPITGRIEAAWFYCL